MEVDMDRVRELVNKLTRGMSGGGYDELRTLLGIEVRYGE